MVVVGIAVDLVLRYYGLTGHRGGAAVWQGPPHLLSLQSGLRPVHAEELRDGGTCRSTRTRLDRAQSSLEDFTLLFELSTILITALTLLSL